MPTRTQMIAAVPRCPGSQTALGFRECGRPLTWRHDHGTWVCRVHGMKVSGEDAAQELAEAKT